MNGHVPFAPVLAKIISIPPVAVESTITESGQLRKQIQIRMEHTVENREPNVPSWHSDFQRQSEYFLILTSVDRSSSLLSNLHNVLHNQVTGENVP